MLWIVRDLNSPGGQTMFELEQDDPPKIGELFSPFSIKERRHVDFKAVIFYEVVGVNLEARIIEVEPRGGPARFDRS